MCCMQTADSCSKYIWMSNTADLKCRIMNVLTNLLINFACMTQIYTNVIQSEYVCIILYINQLNHRPPPKHSRISITTSDNSGHHHHRYHHTLQVALASICANATKTSRHIPVITMYLYQCIVLSVFSLDINMWSFSPCHTRTTALSGKINFCKMANDVSFNIVASTFPPDHPK